MTTACASCGGAVEPHTGPGRPAVYCGEPCRRVVEFKIRSLTRRIDRDELELREVGARSAGRHFYFEDDERKARVRLLRRWLAEDQQALRALLGVPPGMTR